MIVYKDFGIEGQGVILAWGEGWGEGLGHVGHPCGLMCYTCGLICFSAHLDTPHGSVLVDYSKNIITEETLQLLFNLVCVELHFTYFVCVKERDIQLCCNFEFSNVHLLFCIMNKSQLLICSSIYAYNQSFSFTMKRKIE